MVPGGRLQSTDTPQAGVTRMSLLLRRIQAFERWDNPDDYTVQDGDRTVGRRGDGGISGVLGPRRKGKSPGLGLLLACSIGSLHVAG